MKFVDKGVPQGAILEPQLFTVYLLMLLTIHDVINMLTDFVCIYTL